jgi:ferrochelatase
VRILFSAHGIPEKLVAKGDPYQEQVEATVAAIIARLGPVDHRICYQSRVGPMKWLGPSTPEAIAEAGRDGVGAVVVPVAFVSEHIETLVELDIEYSAIWPRRRRRPVSAKPHGQSVGESFIAMLSDAVVGSLGRTGVAPYGPGCQASWKACPFQHQEKAA